MLSGEAETGEKALPVVFAIHDANGRYWLNAAVAMTSVIHHANRPVHIHILHDGSLTTAAHRRLEQIATRMNAPLTLRELRLPESIDTARLGKFSPASLFRLMIPRLFPAEDLVVYLDCDLVVNGVDIHELAALAPPDAAISAVANPFLDKRQAYTENVDDLGLDRDTHFNSGVLALRPKLLQGDLLAEFAAFALESPDALHPDQDFLNRKFRGQVNFVPEKFNTATNFYDSRMVRPISFYAGKILHYAGTIKPLSGYIGPAFVPFLAHAMLVPEIYGGALYQPHAYLFPAEGRPDLARALPMNRDPIAGGRQGA